MGKTISEIEKKLGVLYFLLREVENEKKEIVLIKKKRLSRYEVLKRYWETQANKIKAIKYNKH